ncbi:MAG: RNA-binding S4 domain-containing protein [Actinomycetota bacterium]|nr:RNA-binding S4 domain-containing protein [Actinomycetota bacterium]
MRDVSISDEMIRLGQLLKLVGVVQSGADVKSVLANGEVRVNGEIETRRGRRLHRGDVVAVSNQQLRVV